MYITYVLLLNPHQPVNPPHSGGICILWQGVWGESAGGSRPMCATSPAACMMPSAGKATDMTSNPTCSNDLAQGFWLSKWSVLVCWCVAVCLICECVEEQLPHSGPFNLLELKILFWLTWNIWAPKYPQKPPLTELRTYFLVECTRRYVFKFFRKESRPGWRSVRYTEEGRKYWSMNSSVKDKVRGFHLCHLHRLCFPLSRLSLPETTSFLLSQLCFTQPAVTERIELLSLHLNVKPS